CDAIVTALAASVGYPRRDRDVPCRDGRRDQEPIWMAVQELPLADAATRLGLTPDAVRLRLRRGKTLHGIKRGREWYVLFDDAMADAIADATDHDGDNDATLDATGHGSDAISDAFDASGE